MLILSPMKYIISFLMFSSLFSYAQMTSLTSIKNKAYIDITQADYFLKFLPKKKSIHINTIINFKITDDGHPVFLSVKKPIKVSSNGKTLEFEKFYFPNSNTYGYFLKEHFQAGQYQIEIETELTNEDDLKFQKSKKVEFAFYLKDYENMNFLEKYLPTNFEFDQYKANVYLDMQALKNRHQVFANAKITTKLKNNFVLSYPKFYNSSAFFLHIIPASNVHHIDTTYKSIDGREIPITIYTEVSLFNKVDIKPFLQTTLTEIKYLESSLGEFPHNFLIVHAISESSRLRSMEYAGATRTKLRSLRHELIHSYFGRGVLSADGRSGWIDEAITTWHDKYNNYVYELPQNLTLISNPEFYTGTEQSSYSAGRNLFAYFHYHFSDHGGLRPFLLHLINTKMYSTLTTKELFIELENFYGVDMSGVYQQVFLN